MPPKIVIVTGGSRGLGLAITARLLNDGFKVVAVGRTETDGIARLKQKFGELQFVSFDLLRVGDIRALVTQIVASHGAIYGLINNAARGCDGILANMHDSQIIETISLNLTSAVLMTKYVSKSMLVTGEGRIVNISSVAAGSGYSGLSVYAATKAALLGFGRALARDLGRVGVTVNAVAPGFLETDMTAGLGEDKLDSVKRRSPLGRFVKVEEVASIVAYLMGADGGAITGATLTVDAGASA